MDVPLVPRSSLGALATAPAAQALRCPLSVTPNGYATVPQTMLVEVNNVLRVVGDLHPVALSGRPDDVPITITLNQEAACVDIAVTGCVRPISADDMDRLRAASLRCIDPPYLTSTRDLSGVGDALTLHCRLSFDMTQASGAATLEPSAAKH